ncbi:hypothetical protein DLAC_03221 [Tieghemostelium lacteum]|uniref:Uncharacterized protein n=1 Tax=Tieghemostelium lacteum TaxID=361077 RepID=A0A152A1V9_TIELA|nr:hypothetical protein DLAC_03221 [Tieghemostelium lacteum]|eukprot:KYR00075.1 hypothetical protein DLAC_03221 [Tieghemostelium lacteum]
MISRNILKLSEISRFNRFYLTKTQCVYYSLNSESTLQGSKNRLSSTKNSSVLNGATIFTGDNSDVIKSTFSKVLGESDVIMKKYTLRKMLNQFEINEQLLDSENIEVFLDQLVNLDVIDKSLDIFRAMTKKIAGENGIGVSQRYRPLKTLLFGLCEHNRHLEAYNLFLETLNVYGQEFLGSKSFNTFLKKLAEKDSSSGSTHVNDIINLLLGHSILSKDISLNLMIFSIEYNNENNFKYFYEFSKANYGDGNGNSSSLDSISYNKLFQLCYKSADTSSNLIMLMLNDIKATNANMTSTGRLDSVINISDTNFNYLMQTFSGKGSKESLQRVIENLIYQKPNIITNVMFMYLHNKDSEKQRELLKIQNHVIEYIQHMFHNLSKDAKQQVIDTLILYLLKMGHYEKALQWYCSTRTYQLSSLESVSYFIFLHKRDNQLDLLEYWKLKYNQLAHAEGIENPQELLYNNKPWYLKFTNSDPNQVLNNMKTFYFQSSTSAGNYEHNRSGINTDNNKFVRRNMDWDTEDLRTAIHSKDFDGMLKVLVEKFIQKDKVPVEFDLVRLIILFQKEATPDQYNELVSKLPKYFVQHLLPKDFIKRDIQLELLQLVDSIKSDPNEIKSPKSFNKMINCIITDFPGDFEFIPYMIQNMVQGNKPVYRSTYLALYPLVLSKSLELSPKWKIVLKGLVEFLTQTKAQRELFDITLLSLVNTQEYSKALELVNQTPKIYYNHHSYLMMSKIYQNLYRETSDISTTWESLIWKSEKQQFKDLGFIYNPLLEIHKSNPEAIDIFIELVQKKGHMKHLSQSSLYTILKRFERETSTLVNLFKTYHNSHLPALNEVYSQDIITLLRQHEGKDTTKWLSKILVRLKTQKPITPKPPTTIPNDHDIRSFIIGNFIKN